MIAAAIDVGTNSVQLCVADLTPDGALHILADATTNARLGEGFAATHQLQPEPIRRAVEAIDAHVATARSLGATTLRVVGTSAFRDAVNRADLARLVRDRSDVEIEAISGEDEGRLSYMAIASDPILGPCPGLQAVMDIGGGSTEIIHGRGATMESVTSIRLGASRLTDRFFRDSDTTLDHVALAEGDADALLQTVAQLRPVSRLIAVGGSAVNLARVITGTPIDRTAEVHGSTLTSEAIRGGIASLIGKPIEERRSVVGLEPERAETITAGAVILERALATFGATSLLVSTRALRHGILYELMGARNA